MKPTTPLQSIVDPFVRGLGGELISEIVGNNNPPRSADYLFRRHKVIAELKALEADSFGDSFCRKLGNRMADWHRDGRLRVYGTARVDSKRLSPGCQRDMFEVMAAPLQKKVVSAANSQIESTKQIIDMPDAKGLLWVASDGNVDLQPDAVWYLLMRILQKKCEDGSPQYSNIHAVAYFSPRMLVEVPQSKMPALFWFSGSRQDDDEDMRAFLSLLCDAWPRYVAWAQGIAVRPVDGRTVSPENLRFLGVPTRLPRISGERSVPARAGESR